MNLEETLDEIDLSDLPLWGTPEGQRLLQGICDDKDVPMGVVTDLVKLIRSKQNLEKASKITGQIEDILNGWVLS